MRSGYEHRFLVLAALLTSLAAVVPCGIYHMQSLKKLPAYIFDYAGRNFLYINCSFKLSPAP